MTKVLIIGADSFIGKYLYEAFKFHNYKVVGTSFKKNHIRFPYLNIFETDNYLKVFQKYEPDIVISLAWNTSESFWNSATNKMYYEAYLKFIEEAFKRQVNFFIGIGTSAEYGDLNLNCNSSNTNPNPSTLYGYYKLRTAIELEKFAVNFNANYLWLRLFQVYGEGENKSRLIPTIINLLKEKSGESFTIMNPNKVLDWVYVTDVADALIFLIQKKVNNKIIDVGTSVGTSVSETIDKLQFLYNFKLNLQLLFNGEETGIVCSDSIELFKMGWKPKTSLDQGLKIYKHIYR
jgi:nucleoside-diphosphate-sugar epimerase